VHTASPSNTDIIERIVSNSQVAIASSTGVAYRGPTSASNTNCAWSDHSCGTLIVTSHDNDKIFSLDRRANDADSLEAPPASLQTLTITLPSSGAASYQPRAIATFNDKIIVAMEGTPGYVAQWPAGFTGSTSIPDWYIKASASTNKLTPAISIAVDTVSVLDSATGKQTGGRVFVGSSTGSAFVINGYDYAELTDPGSINGISHVNNAVVTRVSITPTFEPDGIAIDSANHNLFMVSPTAGTQIQVYSTLDGAAKTAYQGKQLVHPAGIAFQPGPNNGTIYVSDNGTNPNGLLFAFPGGGSGSSNSPLYELATPSLLNNATGLVICN
jgi:hypothetical protein